MNDFRVSGTYIWYYYICKREVWLLAHGIEADQEDDNIQLGNIIHETAYNRNTKEISFRNSKFDVISNEKGKIIVGEIKKSSRFLESAKMQLLFYLYELYQNGINAEGQLLIPEERKKEVVILDDDHIRLLESVIEDIHRIVNLETAPTPQKGKYCSKCAYSEFCWA